MKDKKNFLVEALVRKALCYAEMKDSDELFDSTVKQLKAWVDIDANGKYAALAIEREKRAGRYGNALKIIGKGLAKDSKDDAIRPLSKSFLLEERAKLMETLGYTALVEYDQSTRVSACPKSYAPF